MTTHATRKEIQESADTVSTRSLGRRFGINYLTVQKWCRRDSVEDRRFGSQEPCPNSLSKKAAGVLFPEKTLLPLDDCLFTLQDTIPQLNRANLHRDFQKHGISVRPKEDLETPETNTFKVYPIRNFHVDIAQVNTEEGRLYMFVAVDRTSKFAYVELREKSTRDVAVQFIEALVEKVS